MTKIIFLGTSGEWKVTAKQIHQSGGFVIQTKHIQFFVDPGPGAFLYALKNEINPRQNSAILATHNHFNHCADINTLISSMTLNGLDKHGMIIAPQSVVSGSEGTCCLSEYHKKLLEKIIIAKEGNHMGIEHNEIFVFKTKHTEPESVGYKIITNEVTIGYPGDCGFNKDLLKNLEGCDLLILNTKTEKPEDKNNLSIEDAEKIITHVKPKLAIFTHFGLKLLNKYYRQLVREINQRTGVQTIVAKDGMTFAPVNYAAQSSQKRLHSFK